MKRDLTLEELEWKIRSCDANGEPWSLPLGDAEHRYVLRAESGEMTLSAADADGKPTVKIGVWPKDPQHFHEVVVEVMTHIGD